MLCEAVWGGAMLCEVGEVGGTGGMCEGKGVPRRLQAAGCC